jgi:micrococcal nuclease
MILAAFLATVIRISDGDTLTVPKGDKQQVKIRLSEIDAPEKQQSFGAPLLSLHLKHLYS